MRSFDSKCFKYLANVYPFGWIYLFCCSCVCVYIYRCFFNASAIFACSICWRYWDQLHSTITIHWENQLIKLTAYMLFSFFFFFRFFIWNAIARRAPIWTGKERTLTIKSVHKPMKITRNKRIFMVWAYTHTHWVNNKKKMPCETKSHTQNKKKINLHKNNNELYMHLFKMVNVCACYWSFIKIYSEREEKNQYIHFCQQKVVVKPEEDTYSKVLKQQPQRKNTHTHNINWTTAEEKNWNKTKWNDVAKSKLLAHDTMIEKENETEPGRWRATEKIKSHLRLRCRWKT